MTTSNELTEQLTLLKEIYMDEAKWPEIQVSVMGIHLTLLQQLLEIIQRLEALEVENK